MGHLEIDGHADVVRRLKRLERLRALERALAEAEFDLPRFQQLIIERLQEETGADSVVVEMIEGDHCVYRAADPGAAAHLGLRIPIAGSLSGLCVKEAQPLYCADTRTDPRVNRAATRKVGVRAMICAPLFASGEPVGVIKAMARQPDAFGPDAIELLGEIAWSLGSALDKQMAVDRLQAEIEERQRLEASLRANEARLRADTEHFESAFRFAAIGMGLVAPDGRILRVNPSLCRIVGYGEAELLALDFQSITHPDDLAEDLDNVRRLIAGEVPAYQMEKRYVRKDGTISWAHLSVSLVRGGDGAPRHFISQVMDISARKALAAEVVAARDAAREREALYRLLADNAADVILRRPADGGPCSYVSPSIRKLAGYTPEEFLTRPAMDYVATEDLPRVLEATQRLCEGAGDVVCEFRLVAKDGREVWVESRPRLTPGDSGGPPELISIMRAVGDRKALETELRAATAAAEQSAAVKSEFLSNMSHELRTPLTSIVGFTGLAATLADLPPTARDYMGRIGNASRALMSLVNDILDFSKLEAGQVAIKPSPVRVQALCRSTLELFAPQAGAKDLELGFEAQGLTEKPLMLDGDRVRQVLLNLVGNGVKFTASGSVTLSAGYDEAAGRLRVSVRDTGPGVPEDKLGRLFVRFSQVDGSTTRSHGGTGLGLAICKGLVEAMGGTIGADSRAGQGSVFWFELPAAVAADDAPAENGEGGRAGAVGGVRVLVADDHPANRELVRLYLTGAGAEVTEACDGEAAAALAAAEPFDVVLMDVRMPRLDGPGALDRIRAAPGPNDRTPILAFTANAEADERRRLKARGFDGLVPKPVEPAALLEAVAAAAHDLFATETERAHAR